MQRRNFLHGAAGAALAQQGTVRLPRKLRVALIGGDGHAGEILTPLPRLPDVEMVAYTESEEFARIRKNERMAAARKYADYRRMLDQEKPDVVAVLTPNGGRAEAVLACTERKLNWIAEKPLALDRPSWEKLKKAVLASGVKFSILLPMRYDPHFVAMRRIVQSGAIGEVGQISSQKSYKAGKRPKWMREPATYGSTILWIGIHMIDLMRFTSGRDMPEAFSYQTQVLPAPGIGKMENTTGTIFRLDNGGVATLHMDYYRPESAPTHGDDRLRLCGPKGVVEWMAATGLTLMVEGRPPEVVRDMPEEGSVFVDFLEAAYNGKQQSLTVEDIFRANEVTIAAHESALRRQAVKA
jgi:predicted dehydrogenase